MDKHIRARYLSLVSQWQAPPAASLPAPQPEPATPGRDAALFERDEEATPGWIYMRNILLVEDSPEILALVTNRLYDHRIIPATSIAEAEKAMQRNSVDLIILDLTLPDGDGFPFCIRLRNDPATKDIPVIVLTGRNDTNNKVIGFSLGIEDYIVKPFDPVELRARVKSRLNKLYAEKEKDQLFTVEDLRFDIAKQRASALRHGQEKTLDLTPLEFKLLLYFAKHEGHVLSRDLIINEIWGSDIHIVDRTVDTHISNLRKKLHGFGVRVTIKSIYGEGYSLSAASTEIN